MAYAVTTMKRISNVDSMKFAAQKEVHINPYRWAEWNMGQAGMSYIDANIWQQRRRYLREAMRSCAGTSLIRSSASPSIIRESHLINKFNEMLQFNIFFTMNLPGFRTCFNKQSTQSTAAFENTRGLCVFKKTWKTSRRAARWPAAEVDVGVDGIVDEAMTLTTRKAPNRGLQPDLISVLFASTNSQMQLTI